MFKKLFSRPFSRNPSLAQSQRKQLWSLILVFTGLGFYVGVWAVLIADLANAFSLTPVQLGIALACFPCVGIVVLLFGGFLTDHLSRRVMLLLGIGGLSILFVALALVSQYTCFSSCCSSAARAAVATISPLIRLGATTSGAMRVRA